MTSIHFQSFKNSQMKVFLALDFAEVKFRRTKICGMKIRRSLNKNEVSSKQKNTKILPN